jgi:hypothetical protein
MNWMAKADQVPFLSSLFRALQISKELAVTAEGSKPHLFTPKLTWQNVNYRLDVYRTTNGIYVELIKGYV